MQKYSGLKTALAATVLISFFSLAIVAQENRQIHPSFPINTGERMLTIATGAAKQLVTSSEPSRYDVYPAGDIYLTIPIHLPVGTTLKRVVAEFVDDYAGDMRIYLTRISNADMTTVVDLRDFNTNSVNSTSYYDFQQVVSNPLSHSMLQGWTYYVRIHYPPDPGGYPVPTPLFRSGVVKVIYEPAP